MTDYNELKRLADELIAANDLFNESPQDNEVGDAWSLANDRFTEAASPEVILALIAENDRLDATNNQLILLECNGGAAQAAINLLAERDLLKAENEALRDDIEQNQYDANAWRNSEESVWIEVFNSEGDEPFISAITGQITVEQLALIQAEILEYREDYFEKGSGLYVFRCAHYQAHHDNVGMTEPAHWETDFESYSPFPWEEEAAALVQGEQS